MSICYFMQIAIIKSTTYEDKLLNFVQIWDILLILAQSQMWCVSIKMHSSPQVVIAKIVPQEHNLDNEIGDFYLTNLFAGQAIFTKQLGLWAHFYSTEIRVKETKGWGATFMILFFKKSNEECWICLCLSTMILIFLLSYNTKPDEIGDL